MSRLDCYLCTKPATVKYKGIPYCNGCLPKEANARPPVLVPEPEDPHKEFKDKFRAKAAEIAAAGECTGTCDPGDSVKCCTSANLCTMHKCTNIDCYC